MTGELVWHGPPRAGFTTKTANYYPIEIGTGEFLEEGTAFKLRYAPNASAPLNLIEEPRVHTFTDRLIYGETPDPANRPSAITSYFGYIDPTFDPQKPMAGRPGATAQEGGAIGRQQVDGMASAEVAARHDVACRSAESGGRRRRRSSLCSKCHKHVRSERG